MAVVVTALLLMGVGPAWEIVLTREEGPDGLVGRVELTWVAFDSQAEGEAARAQLAGMLGIDDAGGVWIAPAPPTGRSATARRSDRRQRGGRRPVCDDGPYELAVGELQGIRRR